MLIISIIKIKTAKLITQKRGENYFLLKFFLFNVFIQNEKKIIKKTNN